MSDTVGADNKRTLADQVYVRLAESISTGEYPRGTRLVEADLCRRFNVSRTPLRAALAKLERDRLIETHAHRGCVVRGHSRNDIEQLYELRKILEGSAISLAVGRIDSPRLRQLEELIRERRAITDPVNYDRLAEIDKQTHLLLYDASGNPWLVEMIEMVLRILRVYRELDLRIPDRTETALRDHEGILRAVERGDAAEAERLVRDHIDRSKHSVLGSFEPLLRTGAGQERR